MISQLSEKTCFFKELRISRNIINDRTFFAIVFASVILLVSLDSLQIADAKITDIEQIIDSTGDGENELNGSRSITVDSNDNVYVAGHRSDNAFKITQMEQ